MDIAQPNPIVTILLLLLLVAGCVSGQVTTTQPVEVGPQAPVAQPSTAP
jgi:hypothetical protein